MNFWHGLIRFTCESEINNFIHFIGLTITRESVANNLFEYHTTVFGKPTSTSLFISFGSFSSESYRLSVFKCLLHRALNLMLYLESSSYWNASYYEHASTQCLPWLVLDKILKNSLSEFLHPVPKQYGPNKERLYIGLLFLGKSTDSFRRWIK